MLQQKLLEQECAGGRVPHTHDPLCANSIEKKDSWLIKSSNIFLLLVFECPLDLQNEELWATDAQRVGLGSTSFRQTLFANCFSCLVGPEK